MDVGLVRPKTYTFWVPSLRKSMQKYMQTLQKDMNHVNTSAGALPMASKKNFLCAHAPIQKNSPRVQWLRKLKGKWQSQESDTSVVIGRGELS